MRKIFLLNLLTLLISWGCYAQPSMPPDFASGEKLYGEKKYEDAIGFYFKALFELGKSSNKDSATISLERKATEAINSCYFNAAIDNVTFNKLDFDTIKTEQFYFLVTKVNSINDDSAIITINEGRQDGIYPDAECYVAAAHSSDVKDTARSLKYLGSGKVIELTDYTTKILVKFYKKRKGWPIYPKDLLEIKVHPVRNANKGMFYDLSKLGVSFRDNTKSEVLCKKAIYLNTDPALENILADLYTWEVVDFSSYLTSFTDSQFTTKYKQGRFKGYNLIQSFPVTTATDILSFFNFAKGSFYKYNKNFKLNETYATWIINDLPQGDSNLKWILPIIEATPVNQLDQLLRRTAWYISNDSLKFCGQILDAYISDNKIDAARSLCEKLIYIAEYLKDTIEIADFYYRLALIKNAQSYKKEALSDVLHAYNLYKDNYTYTYMAANFYGTNERYDSCFYLFNEILRKYPENYYASGYMGWFKTLAGNLDEAVALCGRAYYADTTSVSFAINFGHTFLLRGNVDSARYFYRKMLDNLNHPTDYTEGPKKDFEIFFSKGWQRKTVAEMAEWLDNEFKQKYSIITEGNLLWEDAKKHYNDKDYKYAIKKWKDYLTLFEKVKDIKTLEIHNTVAWVGICYSSMKQHDSAAAYYEAALQMALTNFIKKRNKDAENDLIADDYKRLYNFYDGKDMKKAEAYKILYDAELQKLADINCLSRLHVLCIGGRDSTENKMFENDARFFFDNITSIGNKKEKAPDYIFINGGDLTKQLLIQKLEEIRKQSKPDDIFVFYYAGLSGSDSSREKEALYFNPKDEVNGKIEIKELMQNIDLVYARKKIIITAEPNPALLNLIATQYTSATGNVNEMNFICPGLKTPVLQKGQTLFTQELVNALDEMKKKEQFYAREYLDKAAYQLGRGQHYLPVLSFSSGKDFILFKNDSLKNAITMSQSVETRGLDINPFDGDSKEPESNTPGTQKNYALFFASDNYDDNNTWHNLSNPIADATSLAALLKEDFGFETEVVKNATKKDIENKLRQYRIKNFGRDDQLMIFFAGHGIYYQEANMGYLVARDSKDPRTIDPNYNTYLSYSDLGNLYLKNIKCRRIFLVLDACYAGSFFEEKSYSRSGPDTRANDGNVMQRLNMLKKNASGKSFYKGISSGGKETVEDGKKDQHSPFAGGFIQLLNNAIPNYYITADAVIGGIQNYHPGNTTPSSGTFNYSDPQGLFLFEVNVKEQKGAIK